MLHSKKQAKICAIQLAHAVLLTQQGLQCEVHYLLWTIGSKIRDSNSCHAQCKMSTCGLKKHTFYCERLANSMCMPFQVRDELAYDLSK